MAVTSRGSHAGPASGPASVDLGRAPGRANTGDKVHQAAEGSALDMGFDAAQESKPGLVRIPPVGLLVIYAAQRWTSWIRDRWFGRSMLGLQRLCFQAFTDWRNRRLFRLASMLLMRTHFVDVGAAWQFRWGSTYVG